MAKVTVGGDAERYMDAPMIQSGDGEGGGSFFAKLLDFVGVGKQVGKIAKTAVGAVDNLTGAQDVLAADQTQNGAPTTGNQQNVTNNKEEKSAGAAGQPVTTKGTGGDVKDSGSETPPALAKVFDSVLSAAKNVKVAQDSTSGEADQTQAKGKSLNETLDSWEKAFKAPRGLELSLPPVDPDLAAMLPTRML